MCIGGLNLRSSKSGSSLVPPDRVLGKHDAVLTVRQGRGEVLQRFFLVKNRILVIFSVREKVLSAHLALMLLPGSVQAVTGGDRCANLVLPGNRDL